MIDNTGKVAASVALMLTSVFVVMWCTHVIWAIRKLSGDAVITVAQIVLGVIGTFFPPVGVIHGIMLWTVL